MIMQIQLLLKTRNNFVQHTLYEVIRPNYDENKRIRGYTSIYNDITDKKEISQLLITDYLTKVYNRRHFNTVFDIELKRAKRDKENFILLLIDT